MRLSTSLLLLSSLSLSPLFPSSSHHDEPRMVEPQDEQKNIKKPFLKHDTDRVSQQIDQILEQHWQKAQASPQEIIDDLHFAKRASLVLIGRRPTYDELIAFENLKAPNKRELFVDQLLDSKGYMSHHYNLWASLLRIKLHLSGFQKQSPGRNYSNFIRQQLQDHKPYDETVHTLLTAKGPLYQKDNGAIGYYLRDRGMPLDHMSNTMRAFAGTRMECAQCHDHPFDEWTQKDFFGMAAFTAGDFRFRKSTKEQRKLYKTLGKDIANNHNMSMNMGDASMMAKTMGSEMSVMNNKKTPPAVANKKTPPAVTQLSKEQRDQKDALRFLTQVLETQVYEQGRGASLLPWNYAYEDAKPFDVVPAKVIMGEQPEVQLKPEHKLTQKLKKIRQKKNRNAHAPYRDVHSREAFANWMIDPKHPRFTRVYVNRVWEQIMGLALTTPYDDIKRDQKASHPALEQALIEAAIQFNYDTRSLEKAIVLSKAFQRQAFSQEQLSSEHFFNGPHFRRLSAEQIWDSLVTLQLGNDVDEFSELYEKNNRLYAYIHKQSKTLGFKQALSSTLYEISKPNLKWGMQRFTFKLDILNSSLSDDQKQVWLDKIDPELLSQHPKPQKLLNNVKKKFKPWLLSQNQKSTADTSEMDMSMGSMMSMDMSKPKPKAKKKQQIIKDSPYIKRASELEGKIYRNHFLRQFGSSDRNLIDGDHRDPSITQALWLLNNFATNFMFIRTKYIYQAVQKNKSPQDKIQALYLNILSRRPDATEMALAMAAYQKSSYECPQDITWSLLNSHEFKFFH